ncbi:MAG: adenine deaminase [Clostridiaceae bacterium]|nr:adenine deaminase [Clostridiaceae bacterium]
MGVKRKQSRIDVALGREKADLIIKNAGIINVFTKEIEIGDIAIFKDIIVGIGSYSGHNEIDAKGKYVCPGLIDSHVHIESSMVTPSEFAKAILPYGTTTIIADPHEITNVCGINGIHYMLNQTRELPLNVYIMIPSCVPATPFEDNGAHLSAEAMEPLKGIDRVLGLGEVMDFVSLLNGDPNMLKKVDLFDHAIIDGHSPSLTGNELNAYRAIGVSTDHECSTAKEALERLRLGMYVQIREGSAARNLETIVTGLMQKGINFSNCLFCTDDKHLEDIHREGHISFNIKKAVSLGLDPIEAICMATINASRCYRLKRLGAVAPGYSADLIILNDIDSFSIDKVLYRGKVVADSTGVIDMPNQMEDKNVINTVRIPHITKEDLAIHLDGEYANCIRIVPNDLVTKKEHAKVNAIDGLFNADSQYSKLAVIERHKALGRIGLGIVSNFNIVHGAIASTVAHDSHNLIVIGDNDEDMILAINEIKRANGGFTVIGKGKVLGTLDLPIAGLMSDQPSDFVIARLKSMIEKAWELGVNPQIDPFTALSFLTLPVIPEIRVTDLGLFDVTEFKYIKV